MEPCTFQVQKVTGAIHRARRSRVWVQGGGAEAGDLRGGSTGEGKGVLQHSVDPECTQDRLIIPFPPWRSRDAPISSTLGVITECMRMR